MKKLPGSILVVDDDPDVLYTARMVLKRYFERVRGEENPSRIPDLMKQESFDVILLDMNFANGQTSGQEGMHWLKKILSLDPEAHVVMNTAYGHIELAVAAMKEGAIDFLVKPWEQEKLLATVRAIFELRKSRREVKHLRAQQQSLNREINREFSEIVSVDPVMRPLFDAIDKVAVTDANVLILGENGTGKELIARAIHRKSLRNQAPFIKVDLGAIPETLFEAELFGHTRGAFTDAKEDRPGRFEVAAGGTLFLDEIGNLSLGLQAKLLTALQSRQITRVGSNQPINLDVRLVCATNKPLQQMLTQHEFRQDLLYRINTVELHLPPLRARTADIPALIAHYLAIYCAKYEKPLPVISPPTLKRLQQYPWPGNIRELMHAIERAVILSEGNQLEVPDFIAEKYVAESAAQPDSLHMEEIEKAAIVRAISQSKGNLTLAAKELGLGRSTLYRKMARYEL